MEGKGSNKGEAGGPSSRPPAKDKQGKGFSGSRLSSSLPMASRQALGLDILSPVSSGGRCSPYQLESPKCSPRVVQRRGSKPLERCCYHLAPIFEFVGPGQWLYVGLVSKRMAVAYDMYYGKTTWGGAAVSGSLGCLHEALESKGFDINMKVRIRCRDTKSLIDKNIPFFAGMQATEKVLIAAKESGMKWDSSLCTGAARAGRLDLLKSLYSNYKIPLGSLIGLTAARAPDSNVLEFLREEGKLDKLDFKSLMLAAAQSGNTKNVAWLLLQGASWGKYVTLEAASFNQRQFLEWAASNGCPFVWSAEDCSRVRRAGASPETLKWLHKQENFKCACSMQNNSGELPLQLQTASLLPPPVPPPAAEVPVN